MFLNPLVFFLILAAKRLRLAKAAKGPKQRFKESSQLERHQRKVLIEFLRPQVLHSARNKKGGECARDPSHRIEHKRVMLPISR